MTLCDVIYIYIYVYLDVSKRPADSICRYSKMHYLARHKIVVFIRILALSYNAVNKLQFICEL
jgi:hypothetical protein